MLDSRLAALVFRVRKFRVQRSVALRAIGLYELSSESIGSTNTTWLSRRTWKAAKRYHYPKLRPCYVSPLRYVTRGEQRLFKKFPGDFLFDERSAGFWDSRKQEPWIFKRYVPAFLTSRDPRWKIREGKTGNNTRIRILVFVERVKEAGSTAGERLLVCPCL